MPNLPRQFLFLDLGQTIGAELTLGCFWVLHGPNVVPSGPGRSLSDFIEPEDPQKAVEASRALAHETSDETIPLAIRYSSSRFPSWWIQAYSLYNGAGHSMPLNQAWMLGTALSRILDEMKPCGLVLCGGGPDHAGVCQALAKGRKLGFRRIKPQRWSPKIWVFRLFGERLKHAFRALNGVMAIKPPSSPTEIFFYGVTLQQLPDGRWTHGNFSAIQEALHGHNVTFKSLFLWNHLHFPSFSRAAAKNDYFALESIFSLGDLSRMIWWVIKPPGPVFPPKAPASADGIGLEPLFKRKMGHFLRWRIPETRLLVNAFTRFLKRTSPRLVVMIDEADSQGLALITACRSLKIPIIAIQHGVLHPQHFGYVHDSRDFKVDPPFPLPDLTLVYGAYFQEVLTSYGHFPENRILVSGSSKYDEMLQRRQMPKDPEFLSSLGLPSGLKVVVLTTQPLPNPEESQAILNATCHAIKQIEDVALLIKPHPREWNLSIYGQAIHDFGLVHARVLPGVDLSRLFHHANLTIAQSSTTLIESLLLYCPAITLNLTGLPELLPYAQSGACLEVTKPDDLPTAINAMLNRSKVYEMSKQATPGFIEAMLGPQDGNSTNRIVELLFRKLNPTDR